MDSAIYARISLDRDGLRAGVDRQIEDCTAELQRRGWRLVDSFVDNNTSAYRGKARPAYEKLLEAVESGQVQAVIAWAPDRLTRHLRELEDLVALVERTNVKIIFCQAGDWDLSNPEGRFQARMIGTVARLEAEKTGSRVARARLQEAQEGRPHMASNRPFGFEEDRVTHRPEEAAAIRDVAQRVLRGESLRSASLRHNKNPKDMSRILKSARIAGIREHKGIRYPAQWEPILDSDTVEALTSILKTKKRDGVKANNQFISARKYLLSGFLECGECGSHMYGKVEKRPNKSGKGDNAYHTYYKYLCHPKGCVIRAMEPLEEYVIAELLTKVDSPRSVPIEIPPELTAAPVKLRAKLDEAKELWKLDILSKEEYAEEKLDLEGRLISAEDALSRAITEAEDENAVPLAESKSERFAPAIDMLNRVNQNYAWWAKADLRQKRVLISKYITKVVVFKKGNKDTPYADTTKIHWKDGLPGVSDGA